MYQDVVIGNRLINLIIWLKCTRIIKNVAGDDVSKSADQLSGLS